MSEKNILLALVDLERLLLRANRNAISKTLPVGGVREKLLKAKVRYVNALQREHVLEWEHVL